MVLLRWFLFVRGLCFELPARRRKPPTHSSMWPLKTNNHEEEKIVKTGYFRREGHASPWCPFQTQSRSQNIPRSGRGRHTNQNKHKVFRNVCPRSLPDSTNETHTAHPLQNMQLIEGSALGSTLLPGMTKAKTNQMTASNIRLQQ